MKLITRNVLECDQSNYSSAIQTVFTYLLTYSSRIILSYTFTWSQIRIGSDEPFQRWSFSYALFKTADGRDLGFGPNGIETFDPPIRKPYHRFNFSGNKNVDDFLAQRQPK